MLVPNDFKEYFIIGLFDGDGSVNINDGYITFTGHRGLYPRIFRYLGFYSSDIREVRRKDKDGNITEYSEFIIRNVENCQIFYDMYLKYSKNIFVLDRKKDIIQYFFELRKHKYLKRYSK